MGAVRIVEAQPEDIPQILEFIKELAAFEKLSHEVKASVESLRISLFGEGAYAHVLFVEENDIKVGFALYFFNYSTFLSQPGLYLEDLFILPSHRSKGYGLKMMIHLAKLAVSKGCGRFEWSVLDWNTRALDFYQSLGAQPQSEWTVQRLTGSALLKLSQR